MFYVEIYIVYMWKPIRNFMCKSIADYYCDRIHQEDKVLTRVRYYDLLT